MMMMTFYVGMIQYQQLQHFGIAIELPEWLQHA